MVLAPPPPLLPPPPPALDPPPLPPPPASARPVAARCSSCRSVGPGPLPPERRRRRAAADPRERGRDGVRARERVRRRGGDAVHGVVGQRVDAAARVLAERDQRGGGRREAGRARVRAAGPEVEGAQVGAAEVAVQVAAREVGQRRVADHEAADDRAAGLGRVAAVLVGEERRGLAEGGRARLRGRALHEVALAGRPAEVGAAQAVLARGRVGEAAEVDLLPRVLPHVADDEVAGDAVEGGAERVAQAVGEDLRAGRRARDRARSVDSPRTGWWPGCRTGRRWAAGAGRCAGPCPAASRCPARSRASRRRRRSRCRGRRRGRRGFGRRCGRWLGGGPGAGRRGPSSGRPGRGRRPSAGTRRPAARHCPRSRP